MTHALQQLLPPTAVTATNSGTTSYQGEGAITFTTSGKVGLDHFSFFKSNLMISKLLFIFTEVIFDNHNIIDHLKLVVVKRN